MIGPKTKIYSHRLDPEIGDTLYQCDACGMWSVDRVIKTEADDYLCEACYAAAPTLSDCCGSALLPYDQPMCSECKDHCEAVK